MSELTSKELVEELKEVYLVLASLEGPEGEAAVMEKALLQSLLANRDLRAQALRALAGFDDPKTPAGILAAYGTFDSQEQRDALNTLSSRASFALPS